MQVDEVVFGSEPWDEAPSEEPEVALSCKGRGQVMLHPSPFRFFNGTAENADRWSEQVQLVPARNVYQTRWLAVTVPSEQAEAATALRRYVSTAFPLFAFGRVGGSYVAILRKERQAWHPPSSCAEHASVLTVELARLGRVEATSRVFAMLKTFFSCISSALATVSVQSDGEDSLANAGETYRRIADRWSTLADDAIDEEVGLAKATASDRRTPEQAMIISAGSELKRTAERRRSMMRRMRIPISCSQIPFLDDVEGLGTIVAKSFDTNTGATVQMTLMHYISSGEFARRGLVLMGTPGLGKTPTALALGRCLTTAWPQEAQGEQFLILSTTIDALRGVSSLLVPGTCLVLDDFTPACARGGRGSKPSCDDLKALFTCGESLPISTRYSDTVLCPGGRIVTTNALQHSDFHPSLSDSWETMSPHARLRLSSDGQALMKRLLFVRLSGPCLKRKTAQEHSSSKREDFGKRAKSELVRWSRGPLEGEDLE